MTFAAGDHLGSYLVQDLLGVGGMGEVYRATDSRLDRQVAVKVLPEEFFEERERVARFEREAKALAALNHHGIAAVHSFEEVSGRHILVMELVEGEGLDTKIASGPLPPDELLSLAIQIAEALSAAHRKGIVHRDLKPSNVKVSPEGRVKLLDFGLAKMIQAESAEGVPAALTQTPTASAGPTVAGTVLGTPAYMSPEQARGGAVDHRADIWALGCVLYACVSGRSPFQRGSLAETLGAIFTDSPAIADKSWASYPAGLTAIVRKCLAKDPGGRYGSAEEVAAALRPASQGERASGRTAAWKLAPAVLTGLAVLASAALWLRERAPAPAAARSAARETPAGGEYAAASSAFAVYQRADEAYQANTKADNSRAIELYEEAIRIDPSYAAAHAGLAFACARYSFQYFDANPAWAARMEQAADSSLAVGNGRFLAQSHQARAWVLSSLHHNFDFRAALPEVRRALELSPNFFNSHFWLGVGYGLHLGTFDEGLESLRRASEIKPSWSAPWAAAGVVHLMQGKYEEAVADCRKSVALSPKYSVPYVTLADALLRQGRTGEAEAEIATALRLEPRNTWATSLAAVIAASKGRRDEARRLLDEAARTYDDHHVGYNAVLVSAILGDAAGAVAGLRKVVRENLNPHPWFLRDPLLDRIRGDKGFQEFLAESARFFEQDRRALAAP